MKHQQATRTTRHRSNWQRIRRSTIKWLDALSGWLFILLIVTAMVNLAGEWVAWLESLNGAFK